jgi:hypothetical protein
MRLANGMGMVFVVVVLAVSDAQKSIAASAE